VADLHSTAICQEVLHCHVPLQDCVQKLHTDLPLFWIFMKNVINPLNAVLNPIYYLLALVEAHHILHVCRIRVNHLTVDVKLIL
jgi:hypothetical protein